MPFKCLNDVCAGWGSQKNTKPIYYCVTLQGASKNFELFQWAKSPVCRSVFFDNMAL